MPFARARGAARVLSWPASVNSIYQRTIRDSGSTVAKRALLRQRYKIVIGVQVQTFKVMTLVR